MIKGVLHGSAATVRSSSLPCYLIIHIKSVLYNLKAINLVITGLVPRDNIILHVPATFLSCCGSLIILDFCDVKGSLTQQPTGAINEYASWGYVANKICGNII